MKEQVGPSHGETRRPTVIFGAGPFARLLRQQLEEARRPVAAFVVDEAYRNELEHAGLPLLGWTGFLQEPEYAECEMLVGVGYRSMRLRREVAHRAEAAGRTLGTFISPAASVSASAGVGPGCVLFAGCIIEPFVQLGRNNLLWSGTIVCHDTVVGDHNYFSPGVIISGECRIGSGCFMGTRSTLIDSIRVGDDCQILAGSVLCEDAASDGAYAGLPAKRRKEIDPSEGVRIMR